VEVRGADVAGMAVHIGARVAALAAPGEVLVSSTVRDIVTGSRHRFADRGESALKGVPGEWRLCALVREHVTVRR
jgi:class 3 adenylate cyclase